MGDWGFLTADEMAAQSELIVVGELVGRLQLNLTGAELPDNIGIVKVDEVLKGDRATSLAPLLLTPTRPSGYILSTDVSLQDGQRGLWYLRAVGEKGLFEVNRPDRFLNFEEAGERIQALRAVRDTKH